MTRPNLFLLLFALGSTISFGQENILFRDDFDDNHNEWLVFDKEFGSAEIASGLYKISNFGNSYRLFTKGIFIDPKADFYVEMSMTHEMGGNEALGLVWGLSDAENFYGFDFSSDRDFRVYEHRKGKIDVMKSWTKSGSVNSQGQPNVLAIRKKENTIEFSINGQEVYSSLFKGLFGTQVGFILNNRIAANVDYILIKHPPIQINLVADPVRGYKKENLGTNVNSKYEELGPLISPDGKTLYVFRENHPKNTGSDLKQDIWFSTLQEDGSWSVMENIRKPLNNKGHNAVVSVTPDGNTLLLMNTYNADGSAKSSGISISHRMENGWSIPEDVNIKNFYNRNKYTNNCLSADRMALIVSLERDDSFGDLELYVCFLEDEGTWSEPTNLGSTINTFASDFSPFLAADNVTLYYGTYGKPGYGSADIFVTRRLDSTWTNWSEPQNLGLEINSPSWDAYYTIPASGEYAYLVSYETGNADVYRIKVAEAAKPNPVVLIFGKVLNSKTNEPIAAEISYHELATDREMGLASSSPVDGTYKIVLPYGTAYSFLAQMEGYYAVSDNLDVTSIDKYSELERNLYLVPIEVGSVIRLNNIFFDFDKANLKPESYPELERLIKFLLDHPDVKKIEIAGHTDDVGTDLYNQTLSERRTNSVVEYLVGRHIERAKLVARGFGKRVPVDMTGTDEGRAKNRRVEFKILQ